MAIPPECITRTTQTRIVCQEKSSKITFVNTSKQEVQKITVDDCAITKGYRCDYLIINANKTEYFVELKGRGIDHAIEQLEASMAAISSSGKTTKWCFIISSRCPLLTSKIQEIKLIFRRKYNAILIIKNQQYEHPL